MTHTRMCADLVYHPRLYDDMYSAGKNTCLAALHDIYKTLNGPCVLSYKTFTKCIIQTPRLTKHVRSVTGILVRLLYNIRLLVDFLS